MSYRIQNFQTAWDVFFRHLGKLAQKHPPDLGNTEISDLGGKVDFFSQPFLEAGFQLLKRTGKSSLLPAVCKAREQVLAVVAEGSQFLLQIFQSLFIEPLPGEHILLEL